MAPKFGTSGLRGLVTELTPRLVADHVRAFLSACPIGSAVHVGWDLRPSSPDIAGTVLATLGQAGAPAVVAGAVPTPALALSAMNAGAAAIMITGSHIPADRNGLKFYTPEGEITKAHEAAILAALGAPVRTAAQGARQDDPDCGARWVARYVTGFGARALAGLRIGVYEHSSVARDLMGQALHQMGAEVVPLARSDIFIPVDTEAVDPDTRERLAGWCADHRLDAVVSTDGDADRPMVTDAAGAIVPGDVLGALTARMLGASDVITPVSSNSLVDEMGDFTVARTRIGSPYVIAGMEETGGRVVGYEPNGGFLLGFAATGPAGALPPLMTRDCLLPIVAPLAAARAAGQSLADLVAALPARFTAADRLQGIATEASSAFIARLTKSAEARAAFLAEARGDGTPETGLDLTDGLRSSFADGTVLHLRPSGNAPEFRVYAEATTAAEARALVAATLAAVGRTLSPG